MRIGGQLPPPNSPIISATVSGNEGKLKRAAFDSDLINGPKLDEFLNAPHIGDVSLSLLSSIVFVIGTAL